MDIIKNKFCDYRMLMTIFLLTFGLTGCQAVTSSGQRVGIGNTIIFIIISAILTAIVGGIGFVLSLILVVGVIFKWITIIGIAGWWIIMLWTILLSYGWLIAIIGIIIAIIIIGSMFGGGGGGLIFIFWK